MRVLLLMLIFSGLIMGCGNQKQAIHKTANNQKEAQQIAKTVDLPLIQSADKIVIKQVREGNKEITITDQSVIQKLHSHLKPQDLSPSGGLNQYQIAWFKGEKLLRVIWVFPYGEWGFQRKGISWSIGRSDALVPVIKQQLKQTQK